MQFTVVTRGGDCAVACRILTYLRKASNHIRFRGSDGVIAC